MSDYATDGVEVFAGAGAESAYLAWRDSHPDGFIVNTNIPPSRRYLILHRVGGCWSIRNLQADKTSWTSQYMKACADDPARLEAWAERVGGPLTPCGTCFPYTGSCPMAGGAGTSGRRPWDCAPCVK
jgi:hypothetical protein